VEVWDSTGAEASDPGCPVSRGEPGETIWYCSYVFGLSGRACRDRVVPGLSGRACRDRVVPGLSGRACRDRVVVLLDLVLKL
jgi:hypothetical protein